MTRPQHDPNDDSSDQAASCRKERVIHTRVPAVLEQELKRLAETWRVPVSNVVRVFLEEAVAAVDVVGRRAEGDLRGIAETLASKRDKLKGIARRRAQQPPVTEHDAMEQEQASEEAEARDVLEGIMGYQALVLARDARCAVCGRELNRGQEAMLGVREGEPGKPVLIGRECLPASK